MTALWRLLEHGPGPAAWNLAVDEALLVSHVEAGGPPTLRFYQWATPTLSLGAGQQWPVSPYDALCEELGITVVRRPTGGRAVLHGGDLTYSLVAGLREGFPASVSAVYRRLSQGLQAGLGILGISADPCPTPGRVRSPFACFAVTRQGDLTWRGRKFLGSAQVWRGRSFLQHGSIVLESQEGLRRRLFPSQQPVPLLSVSEIVGAPVPVARLKAALLQGLAQVLGVTFQIGELSAAELGQARVSSSWSAVERPGLAVRS